MDELNKAKLSEKMSSKTDAFDIARTELSESVDELESVVDAGDNKDKIVAAVIKMHVKYQALEKVFD